MSTHAVGATHWAVVDGSLGPLTLVAGRDGIEAVHFAEDAPALAAGSHDPGALAGAAGQVREYLAGSRRAFDLPLALRGSPLQRAVWAEVARIPYGETITYAELARRVGRPEAVRAVGSAVGATPTPLLVPCHRVVGSDGALRGYSGGLERKAALLALERRVAGGRPAEGPAQLGLIC